jgi:hypothetical protein
MKDLHEGGMTEQQVKDRLRACPLVCNHSLVSIEGECTCLPDADPGHEASTGVRR